MAADPTAAQSDCISGFRDELGDALKSITSLQARLVKTAALGGADSFAEGAYAGANMDIGPSDIDAAMAAVLAIRAVLFDVSGNPTSHLLAFAKVAR